MRIFTEAEILELFDVAQSLALVQEGFVAYSAGRVQHPPVQHFHFVEQDGHSCIKSDCPDGDDLFVVKVSSGIYGNAKKGLNSNQGLNLVISAVTGAPLAILLDNGWLTSLRTGLAGRVVAQHLAPATVGAVGIVGTGTQAELQLRALTAHVDSAEVLVWGREAAAVKRFLNAVEHLGLAAKECNDLESLARASQIIVTCTPSMAALISSEWVQPGTHITAVGAAGPGKQELDPVLVGRADLVVADSVAQCIEFGELQHAYGQGLIRDGRLVELGDVLSGKVPGRTDNQQITIADLTGLAIQDVQITKAVLRSHAARGAG